MLNETTVKGNSINVSFSNMPKHLQDMLLADMKADGLNPRDVIRNAKRLDNQKVPGLDEEKYMTKFTAIEDNQFQTIAARMIERYDRAIDEHILASKDIVKAYNEACMADFERATKTWAKTEEYWRKYQELDPNDEKQAKIISQAYYDSVKDWEFNSTNSMVYTTLNRLTQYIGAIAQMTPKINYTDDELKATYGPTERTVEELKAFVVGEVYKPSNDPEEVRAIVEARIEFANAQLEMLKTFLAENANLVNITKDEALMLSKYVDSDNEKKRRDAIEKSKSKIAKKIYKMEYPGGFDCRPIGLGVMMVGAGWDNGFKQHYVDKMETVVQYLMEYDAVIVGHGSPREHDLVEGRFDKFRQEVTKLIDRYCPEAWKDERKDISEIDWSKVPNTVKLQIESLRTRYVNQVNILRKVTRGSGWRIDEITTPTGAKFTDANLLLKHLIKNEGMKKFLLLSCNGGHQRLDKEIEDDPTVLVRYADNILYSESAVSYIDGIIERLDECYQELFGIADYAYNQVELNESILSNVKDFIKKKITFLVGKFKEAIDFVKKVLLSIRNIFKDIRKNKNLKSDLQRPLKAASIGVNAGVASVNVKYVNTWGEFEAITLKSCDSVQGTIQNLQKTQIKNMNDIMKSVNNLSESSVDLDIVSTMKLVELL